MKTSCCAGLSRVISGDLGYLGMYSQAPEIYLYPPPNGVEADNAHSDVVSVPIRDVRDIERPMDIHYDGFNYLQSDLPLVDFSNDESIKTRYYPSMVRLALDECGGERAFVFDHLVRQRDPETSILGFGKRGPDAKAGALGRVHTDYSEASGQKRLQWAMDRFGIEKRPLRYCIVNLWRSIGGVIEDTPLALCDARSVSALDLVPSKLRYGNRDGEIYLVKHNESHRWWYRGEMDNEDVVVFKQFDSLANGVSRYVPHSAFDLPGAEEARNPRRSIEVRVFVVME